MLTTHFSESLQLGRFVVGAELIHGVVSNCRKANAISVTRDPPMVVLARQRSLQDRIKKVQRDIESSYCWFNVRSLNDYLVRQISIWQSRPPELRRHSHTPSAPGGLQPRPPELRQNG